MDARSGQSTPWSPFEPQPDILDSVDTADLDAWLSSWAAESTRPPATADLGLANNSVSPAALTLADTPVRGGTPVHHHRPSASRRATPRSLALSPTQPPPPLRADSRNSSRTRANFGPEAIKTLKEWFALNEAHPFANTEDLDLLQAATGLKKKQILMWLANTRRRTVGSGPNSGMSTPVSERSNHDIGRTAGLAFGGTSVGPPPPRRATPVPFERSRFERSVLLSEGMNPLERWQNSPPEHEAANVSAIANAVSSATDDHSYLDDLDDDDGRGNSSTNNYLRARNKSRSVSSVETSNSSRGSSSSAYSGDSKDSLRLRKRLKDMGSRRRRSANRRRGHHHPQTSGAGGRGSNTTLLLPQHIYQCTFCPETYKTKYDWQRHEKTMHLSLDQWVCSPDGATVLVGGGEDELDTGGGGGQLSCVYCGAPDPDEAHLLGQHNHAMCCAGNKPLRERTFFRKDHLVQHLRLVHKAAFRAPQMDRWKVSTERLHSRCGFCDQVMDTWAARLNHIAAHFKAGTTMAHWKGNWGFEPAVLEMLENAMPPYLIHYERNTPMPLNVALTGSPEPLFELGGTSSYELIKTELRYYIEGNAPYETIGIRGKFYSDDFLHYESCCIVFGSEASGPVPSPSQPQQQTGTGIEGATGDGSSGGWQISSWLRDLLLLSNPAITEQAKMQPLNWVSKARMSQLRIHGKKSIFEDCPFEQELLKYVMTRSIQGLAPATDAELQQQAVAVVSRAERAASRPSERFSGFLSTLIEGSVDWLVPFRERAAATPAVMLGTGFGDMDMQMPDFDSPLVGFEQLRDVDLAGSDEAHPDPTTATTDWITPSIYPFNALAPFHEPRARGGMTALRPFTPAADMFFPAPSPTLQEPKPLPPLQQQPQPQTQSQQPPPPLYPNTQLDSPPLLLAEAPTGADFGLPGFHVPIAWQELGFRHLTKELYRFVAMCMSPNNPNRHVPTDEELQYQARWVDYDDDDPWNQTPADNPEWLLDFKKLVGIPCSGSGGSGGGAGGGELVSGATTADPATTITGLGATAAAGVGQPPLPSALGKLDVAEGENAGVSGGVTPGSARRDSPGVTALRYASQPHW